MTRHFWPVLLLALFVVLVITQTFKHFNPQDQTVFIQDDSVQIIDAVSLTRGPAK